METYVFMMDYKKEKIRVTLEFPDTAEEQAEQEFFGRLKYFYLEKIKSLCGQEREATIHCQSGEKQEVSEDGN